MIFTEGSVMLCRSYAFVDPRSCSRACTCLALGVICGRGHLLPQLLLQLLLLANGCLCLAYLHTRQSTVCPLLKLVTRGQHEQLAI